jgi:hypothetical protein
MEIIPDTTLSSVKNLVRTLEPIDINSNSIEIEVRFGLFDGVNFTSGISRATFNRVKQIFITLDPRYNYIHTEDRIFRDRDTPGWPYDQNSTERYTTVYNSDRTPQETYCLVKSKIKTFDIPEYSFRIAVSKETTNDSSPPSSRPIKIREKKRWSFEIYQGRFRIDLTEVTFQPENRRDTKTVFEIEIEILSPKLENLDYFAYIIEILLKEIQGTLIIYKSQEKANIITKINDLIGASVVNSIFVDVNSLIQPRNLKIRDLAIGQIIPSTNRSVSYTVTIKTDGIRRLLVIDSEGIYLVYSDQVNKIAGSQITDRIPTWHGTIFESEYIPKSSLNPDAPDKYKKAAIYAAIFDCLTTSKKSGVWLEDQPIRMEYVQKFVTMMQGQNLYIFETKRFLPFSNVAEFYLAVNEVLSGNYPFKTDGCIFTPSNYQYDASVNDMDNKDRILSQKPDIMKWKPPSELTIDFAIKHTLSEEGNYIELLVKDGNELVPFTGSPFDPRKDIEIIPKLQNAPNYSIMEFRWVSDNNEDTYPGKFVYVKDRDDKPYPNKKGIALDVWSDIHKPIDEATIRGQKFQLSFRYHNREKWTLFNSVGKALPISNTRVLLDIGSGKGGDVNKWVANKFTHVICVEPNEENRRELAKRLSGTNIQYRIVPTVGQDWENIVQNVRQFSPNGFVDVISCMLSLSFFFDSAQSTYSIAHLVNNTLSRGGYFISLSIDGRYVLEYFTNPANFKEINGNRKSNMSLIDFQLRSGTPEINLLHVFINIPNSIVINQVEYLTNLPDLQGLLTQLQPPMEMISEWRTNKEMFLLQEEIEYTKLFTCFIMKRK